MSAERIKAARELLAISQTELAQATGLSQGLVSQIERGNRPSTETVLRAIADATGLPWAFFLKSVPEPTASIRFRRYRTASPKVTARAKRTFAELLDSARELMEWAEQPKPRLPIANGGKPDEAEIEALADATRRSMGLSGDEPVRHLTRSLERAFIPVAPIVFVDLDPNESDEVAAIGHFGMSSWTPESRRALVTYFPSAGDRQRFTLAHEVGHLVLHSGTTDAIDAESEADRFAGALLLPKVVAKGILGGPLNLRDLAKIKAECGVSIQALIMRGWHLGLIDESRRISLFKQISARGWRRSEPVVVRNEDPALLGALIDRRYRNSGSTYIRAAEGLGLPAVLLRGMMPPPTSSASGKAGASIATVTKLKISRVNAD